MQKTKWPGRVISACVGFLVGAAFGLPAGEEPAGALLVLAAVAVCGMWHAFKGAP